MWTNASLKEHLDISSVVRSASAVHVEWNLNDPENIDKIGNYRHRPTSNGISKTPVITYDPNDSLGEYTGATLADTIIEGELDDNNDPELYITPDEKFQTLFSLDDCFQPNRPRSGINKLLMIEGRRWIPANNYADGQPRYYAASKQDPFKYWTSYRLISPKDEPNAQNRYPGGFPDTMPVGISKNNGNDIFYIEDACPFVVYKNVVYANRITIKMQTHASDVEGNHVIVNGTDIGDPTFGWWNQQTPTHWTVQVLKNGIWSDAYTATAATTKEDGSSIIGPDGHVELAYGLRIPSGYNYIDKVSSQSQLPENPYTYDAYLVASDQSPGFLYTYNGSWNIEPAIYDWHLVESDYYAPLPIDDIANMETYYNGMATRYRDLDDIQGIRLIVKEMNLVDSTFDLIELSPRMVVDVTDMVESYSIKSPAASMDATDLPVGYLLPGTGSITLVDNESLFNDPNSIFSALADMNMKFVFYEGADDVDGIIYHIPLKTMYNEAVPPNMDEPPTIKFELRDAFWMLEKMKAPSLFMENVSLSVAIATLLDYIGFSNYDFKRMDKEEVIIPYFYTSNEKTVAEVLQDLARSTQSAMFFDEYNNFIVMYKDYLMSTQRSVDAVLSGNSTTPHIISVASAEKKRYNDGKIDYNERYIQRSIASLQQASFINEDQLLIYKPVLLWEASGSELVRANNEMGQNQSAFSLGACVLNTSLSNTLPYVQNGQVKNNIIDLGESVYWLPRYDGYFYANGEIIKFDAVEYAITGQGNVWISNNAEYQKYFADVPFYGKIYPTGRIRIYTEAEYARNQDGTLRIIGIKRHGRSQFQTPIASHPAGLSDSWTSTSTRKVIEQDSDYLFQEKDLPDTVYYASSGNGKTQLNGGTRVNGIIKNHFRNVQYTETEVGGFKTARAGTVQSSAMVLQGVKDTTSDINNLFVVHKTLEAPFQHYGTRMRIVGEVKPIGEVTQTATGESTYYSDAAGIGNVLTGGSGGIVSNFNSSNNTGYFFEIIALSNTTIADGTSNDDAHNVIFYKNMASSASSSTSKSIPVKMWGGRSNIVVDSGEFVGQSRQATEDFPSVYDLAIESKQIGTGRRFFLYINGKQVGVVDDPSPLPLSNTFGVFSRGTSKLMFENVYALRDTTSTSTLIAESLPSAFGDTEVNTFEAMNKYAINGMIRNSYLDRINTDTQPSTQMYFDEFGTIMRECAYFNIKFDKAYPALKAKISPTFNKMQTYFVSGFSHHAYGAEFLVFNATDKALNLDETTGNYLRIQGVAFTQTNQRSLTIDELYNEISSASDSYTSEMGVATDPLLEKERFRDIRIDRRRRGRNEFTLTTEYVQRQDDAKALMKWLAEELTRPRLLVGLELFPYPILQLGDIVTLDYTDTNNVDFASDRRFVVYNIEYERNGEGLSHKAYLCEV